ncbi:hypothetical protein NHX12_034081 [Muraenolepis orangiensis]|uniref:Uncharacterized protein n=1 Tax=Muraenolepis orangiensis TaxID=630683 RepID=A0A9Q0IKA4_9TELE|nr:hypothetical protein NHX12_034081 [Muraenolepis orangiensis]
MRGPRKGHGVPVCVREAVAERHRRRRFLRSEVAALGGTRRPAGGGSRSHCSGGSSSTERVIWDRPVTLKGVG